MALEQAQEAMMSSQSKYPRGNAADRGANFRQPSDEPFPESGLPTPNAEEKHSTMGTSKSVSGYVVPNDMVIPEKLGTYQIVKVLRQGGMGMVLEGLDENLGRPVAIKVIKPGTAITSSARDRFLLEAKALAKIEHENIVTIYQAGEDRNVLYMAMQLLQGETLEDRLKRDKRLPISEVVRIARGIADGLAVAHERGVIHRDIKPSNIWLEKLSNASQPRVKLFDFGLARSLSENAPHLTQHGQILGTPGYMAPEQARGQSVDERCDLFSLGCVIFHMVSGRCPFQGNDALGLLMSLALDQAPRLEEFNSETPQALSFLAKKLLAKEPEGRPASAQDVVEWLQAIEREVESEPKPKSTMRTPIRREPVVRPKSPTLHVKRPNLAQHGVMQTASDIQLPDEVSGASVSGLPGPSVSRAAPETDEELCPRCARKMTRGLAKSWCVSCGYISGAEENSASLQPAAEKVALPFWPFGILIGSLALVVLTAYRAQIVGQRPAVMLTWAFLEGLLGVVLYVVGHYRIVSLNIQEEKEVEFWKYLDPMTMWPRALAFLPGSRWPICLGSWGGTALICGLVVFCMTPMPRSQPNVQAGPLVVDLPFSSSEKRDETPAEASGSSSSGEPGSARETQVAKFDPPKTENTAGPGTTTGKSQSLRCVVLGYVSDAEGRASELVLGREDESGKIQFAGTVKVAGDSPEVEKLQQALSKAPKATQPDKVPSGMKATWIDTMFNCTVQYGEQDPLGVLKKTVLTALSLRK